MDEERLGTPAQRISANMNVGQQEESLPFLETFTPFIFEEKSGRLIKGNIPQDVLIKHYDVLSQHSALGNFGEKDIDLVYIGTHRSIMTHIENTPDNKFTVAKLLELQKVKMCSYLLSTKSKEVGGVRDRVLIPASVSLSESKGTYKEEPQVKTRRWGGALNPLNWR